MFLALTTYTTRSSYSSSPCLRRARMFRQAHCLCNAPPAWPPVPHPSHPSILCPAAGYMPSWDKFHDAARPPTFVSTILLIAGAGAYLAYWAFKSAK